MARALPRRVRAMSTGGFDLAESTADQRRNTELTRFR
jgi:hypothetical protein